MVLVEKRGKLVSKEELVAAVWPDAFVEESNLTLHISFLRKTLGTAEDGTPYIETIPKRGYRFAGPIRETAESGPIPISVHVSRGTEPDAPAKPEATTLTYPVPRRSAVGWPIVTAALLLVALALALIHFRERKVESRAITFLVTPPERFAFGPSTPVISPDGTRLAFVAS